MSERGRMTLILGGARSGKSTFAEKLAKTRGTRVLFVATAEAGDDEMRRRIEAHQRVRPALWTTLEAPMGIAEAIAQHPDSRNVEVVLLDCVTLLVANVIGRTFGNDDAPSAAATEEAQRWLDSELRALFDWIQEKQAHMILVSNEVGLGLVPPYPMGRVYRDLLGWANQRLAAESSEVYLMVAGIPLELKKLARLLDVQANGQARDQANG